ncbi:MAG: hypothetical protein RJA34_334 [Pseudomonadota bacterium]|jgi:predicted glycoside hydrolase/deacetylase ChbG (UPF0249 family)
MESRQILVDEPTALHRAERRLVLCADDFAVHDNASIGIAKLATLGRLSATSAMVLSPRWPTDVALLRELRGHIDVGLHLDWTSEFAIAAGHGMSLGRAMAKSVLGGFDRVTARREIERQLQLFDQHWGAPPDHIDGHQHVQQFAGLRDALLDVLREAMQNRWAGAVPYLRISRAPAGQADIKARIIAAMGAQALQVRATAAGVPVAPALSGIYNFDGDGPGYARHMQHWLRTTPHHGIIMCHPALGVASNDPIGPARDREYHYLASPDFAHALVEAGVVLGRGMHRH